MKRSIWTLTFLLILTAGSVIAADHDGKPYVGSKAFERIKTLVGAWEGQMDMGQGPMKITSSYKISAGGTECSGRIPTISEWGLVILALLLLAGGKVYFGRRDSLA